MWRVLRARRIPRFGVVNRSNPSHSADELTPTVPNAARAPSTAVNLGALIGVQRDDGPTPSVKRDPPPLRPRVPTLQFYGSPPVIRTKMASQPPHAMRAINAPKAPLPARASAPPLPPRAAQTTTRPIPPRAARTTTRPPPLPPRPATRPPPPPRSDTIATPPKPLEALIAAELSRGATLPRAGVAELDIDPATLPLLDSPMDIRATDLVETGIGANDARDDRPNDARSERPAPHSSSAIVLPFARWRQKGTLLAAAGLAAAALASLAVNVGVAVCVVDSLSSSTPPAALALVSLSVRAGAPSAARAPKPAPRVCDLAGEPRVVARRVVVAGGIESSVTDGRFALGVMTSPREGRALEVDVATLATIASARIGAALPLRRVVPLLPTGDVVDAAGDVGDGARTAIDPRGAVTIAPARIWKIGGIAPVEAVRATPLTSMKGYAVAFRRASAIWLGATGGDDAGTPYASLVRLSEPGRRVGAPSVAVSGDAVVAAWAERTADTPWRIKWTRWRPGLAPESTHDFVIPVGGLGEQAMSPSVAGLGDGRVLLAWTEGPPTNRQVRVQLIGADDVPAGDAIAVSADGVFSGQGQVAVGADGRGIVAFFASRSGEFDVVAAPLACKR